MVEAFPPNLSFGGNGGRQETRFDAIRSGWIMDPKSKIQAKQEAEAGHDHDHHPSRSDEDDVP